MGHQDRHRRSERPDVGLILGDASTHLNVGVKRDGAYNGTAMVARMPMIAMMIISPMSVTPRSPLRVERLLWVSQGHSPFPESWMPGSGVGAEVGLGAGEPEFMCTCGRRSSGMPPLGSRALAQ